MVTTIAKSCYWSGLHSEAEPSDGWTDEEPYAGNKSDATLKWALNLWLALTF